MRPAEISDDTIIQAGRRLQARGKNVNGWSLRAAMDNKGRPERNLSIWERHLAEGAAQPDHADKLVAVTLPPGVAETADEARAALISHFDGIILKLAGHTEETLKGKYKADFDRLAAERTGMAEQLGLAELSVAQTEQALLETQADVEAVREMLANTQREGAILAERTRSLEAKAAADAAQADGRIMGLEEQAREFTAALQRGQRAQAGAEATATAAEREAERLRTQLDELAAKADAARAEAAQVRLEIAVERGRSDRLEADVGRVSEERDASLTQTRTAMDRAGVAEQRAAVAEEREVQARARTERAEQDLAAKAVATVIEPLTTP
jgi:chromosome segregation ATPase